MGKESHQQLVSCLAGQPLLINWSQTDRYQRLLAKVIAGERDCNLVQLTQGYAWHYKYYEKDQPLVDRQRYAAAEQEARHKQRGLWQMPCPTPPWDWRRKKINSCEY